MIRSRIVSACVLLAALAGCSTAQHRSPTGLPNRQGAASDPIPGDPTASTPSAGIGRFFPGLPGRESLAADPKAKAGSTPGRSRAPSTAPPRAESLAKASSQPPRADKKVFAPFARIEARWAARTKAARSAQATPTTASVMRGPEPESLPRSISVAVHPDDPPAPSPSNPGRRSSTGSTTPAPPAVDPTADAGPIPRDDDARRARVEPSDAPEAEPGSDPSSDPASPKDEASDKPAEDRVAEAEPPGPSPFAAPEPPRLPPAPGSTPPSTTPPPKGRPPRPIHFLQIHIHLGSSPADRSQGVKLPPLGLPPDLPPPTFLRSYYGLDPAPARTAPVPAPTATAPSTAPGVTAPAAPRDPALVPTAGVEPERRSDRGRPTWRDFSARNPGPDAEGRP